MTIQQDLALEQTDLDIGIVALTDCAPLVMAKHLGFFELWGLQVNLHIQHSWATVRDRLHTGLLDAAQMLAPMPLASTLGLNGAKCDVINAFNLSMNGNGITLSTALFEQIKQLNNGQEPVLPLDSSWINQIVQNKRDNGHAKLRFAAVYPYSCHLFQLRDWLSIAEIDVDNDIEIIIIPPTEMTAALENDEIDGFCVGTPWNTKAVRAGIGATVITSCDIWQEAPEKVLAVTSQWQQQHPNTFIALLAAVQQTCEWLNSTANRFEAAAVLQTYLGEPLDVIAPSLIGSCLTTQNGTPRNIPAYNRFISKDANLPKLSQGRVLLDKMAMAHQLPHDFTQAQKQQLLKDVYRPDLYKSMLDMKKKMTQLGDIQYSE